MKHGDEGPGFFVREGVAFVNGYAVPGLKIGGPQDGMHNLVVDDRFLHRVPAEAMPDVVLAMANIAAVAAGFSYHGRGGVRLSRGRVAKGRAVYRAMEDDRAAMGPPPLARGSRR